MRQIIAIQHSDTAGVLRYLRSEFGGHICLMQQKAALGSRLALIEHKNMASFHLAGLAIIIILPLRTAGHF